MAGSDCPGERECNTVFVPGMGRPALGRELPHLESLSQDEETEAERSHGTHLRSCGPNEKMRKAV